MNSELEQRLALVRSSLEASSVSLSLVTSELDELVGKLCRTFDLPYGSLIRVALAIRNLDGDEQLTKEHLQEAAQHLIIGNDSP
jgi:hypothetical protein